MGMQSAAGVRVVTAESLKVLASLEHRHAGAIRASDLSRRLRLQKSAQQGTSSNTS